jgi:hypothetical protein
MTASTISDNVGTQSERLGALSRAQWKSGLAAWLGWLFDGLDMPWKNFITAWLARRIGDRRAIALMCMGYFLAMVGTYVESRDHRTLMVLLPFISIFSGLFALFTMYLPPRQPINPTRTAV